MENFRAKLCIKDLELNRWIFLEAVLAIMLLRSMICNDINILENILVLLCGQVNRKNILKVLVSIIFHLTK